MVVDIGGGSTNIASISLSGIVYSHMLRVASNAMDHAVMHYLKDKHNLLVGERTAEWIKREIESAYPFGIPFSLQVEGSHPIGGVRRTLTVDDNEIREALSECVAAIVNAVRTALERIPPDLAASLGTGLATGDGPFARAEPGVPRYFQDGPRIQADAAGVRGSRIPGTGVHEQTDCRAHENQPEYGEGLRSTGND